MAIIVRLDLMLARRKMNLTQLSEAVDVSVPNLSILKTGKARAIRFSTLERLCEVLECQPRRPPGTCATGKLKHGTPLHMISDMFLMIIMIINT